MLSLCCCGLGGLAFLSDLMSRTREAGKRPLKWCKVHLLGTSLSTYKFIRSCLCNRMFALFSKYGG